MHKAALEVSLHCDHYTMDPHVHIQSDVDLDAVAYSYVYFERLILMVGQSYAFRHCKYIPGTLWVISYRVRSIKPIGRLSQVCVSI